MVTGKPWDRPAPRSSKPLVELTGAQRADLFARFREFYPLRNA